jgi:CHAT domain-containing protein
VLISQVVPGSNAAQSGLKAGDVLLEYAGKQLAGPPDLSAALRAKQPAPPPESSRSEAGIPVQVWRQGRTLALAVRPGPLGIYPNPQPAAAAIRAQREGDRAVRASRGGPFTPLPGTRREVEAIAALFEQPLLLLGTGASASRLHELAASGQLGQFRFLHLATHGVMNDRIALQSAVILAQDRRLTAEEVLGSWKLDADLVTLSACQSGLGRQAGGEGYLGFAQALFLAGARSLVLSLWKVDDTATALLMTRFYQNLLGHREGLARPLPKAEALREAKAWLRGLTAAEVERVQAQLPAAVRGERRRGVLASSPAAFHPYPGPYFWSAFILLGDPN